MLGHSHIIRLVVSTFWRIHFNLKLSMNTSVSVKVVHEFGTSLDKLQVWQPSSSHEHD